MTIRELYRGSGLIPFEASQLLQKIFGWDRTQLPLHLDEPVSDESAGWFHSLAEKRRSGYPLQYLLGEWEFYGLPFFVGEGVLIPRGDTETLVDVGLQAAAAYPAPRICDLCSGSGCIAAALSKNLPAAASITAVELSSAAYAYLCRNVERNQCSAVRTVQADVLTWVPDCRFDLILSNPPYLAPEEMAELQREVTFEPAMALEAAEDGLYFYSVLSRRYLDFLQPGGTLAFEVGYRQADAVAGLLRQHGYSQIQKTKDLNGIERVVSGSKALLT